MDRTVVFVVLDSLRYDITEEYLANNPDGALAELARDGTTFHGATATAPWSLPSHASMFTGQYPSEHGAVDVDTRIPADQPTLIDIADDAGFSTACFTANPWVTPEYGFNGWDHHLNASGKLFATGSRLSTSPDGAGKYRHAVSQIASADRSARTFWNGVYQHSKLFRSLFDDGGGSITNGAQEWLEQSGDAFVFLNYMETHGKHRWLTKWSVQNLSEIQKQDRHNDRFGMSYYREYPNYEELSPGYIRRLMRDELAYVDDCLDDLRRTLAETGRADSTLFVVCSDHGEGLGERDYVYHVAGLTEAMIRTPLIVSGPDPSPDDVTDRVSLAWLFETVRDFIRGEQSPGLLDPDSAPRFLGAETTGRLQGMLDDVSHLPEHFLQRKIAVYDRQQPLNKVVERGGSTYGFTVDQRGLEETETDSVRDGLIDEFQEQLDARTTQTFDLSEGTRRNLEQLGYL